MGVAGCRYRKVETYKDGQVFILPETHERENIVGKHRQSIVLYTLQ